MSLEIRRDDWRLLAGYASISSRFATYDSRLKSYDDIPGNSPLEWPERFDVTEWVFLSAWDDQRRIGGAIVVVDPKAAKQLGGSENAAVLWDLRVAEDVRRRGIGRALVEAAGRVARDAHCAALDVETQDINVGACRLYAACGFALVSAVADAYRDLPGETKLIWTTPLASG